MEIRIWRASHHRIIVIFLFALLCQASQLKSQILNRNHAEEWINQSSCVTIAPQVDSLSVGNYPVLDQNASIFKEKCKKISKTSAGTLFLVVRPKTDTVSGKRLLKMGAISLYRDSVRVDGQVLEIEPIKDEPVIVKVKFQARPRKSWFSKSYNIGDEVELAEVLFYDQLLSDTNVRIVESFLAIKYSVKLTEICTKELPGYLSLYNDWFWDMKADDWYDEEVMGLGRMDRAGFYQSQSFSADSKRVKIALDSMETIGGGHQVNIQDSSLLVLSKGGQFSSKQCGVSPADFLFKLKLFNWVSDANRLLVEVDSVFNYTSVVLSDGLNALPVQHKVLGGVSYFEIPIATLISEKSYFVVGVDVPDTCDFLYDLDLSYCDSSGQNSLTLTLDSSLLPSNCSIININTRSRLDTVVSRPVVSLTNINQGNYEMIVSNQSGVIVHSVFEFVDCSSLNYAVGNKSERNEKNGFDFENTDQVPDKNELDSSSGLVENIGRSNILKRSEFEESTSDEAVWFYPNPVNRGDKFNVEFSNVDDVEFTIQILDNKGALLNEKIFIPTSSNSKYQFTLSQPGTFIVRVLSSEHIAIQTFVVK